MAAWEELRSPSASLREASIDRVLELMETARQNPLEDSNVSGILERLWRALVSSLLDPNPSVALKAALALFGDGLAPGTCEGAWAELVPKAEAFLCENRVGLLTLTDASLDKATRNRVLVSVEVADRLSPSFGGLHAHVQRPTWLNTPYSLGAYISISGVDSSYSLVSEEDAPTRHGFVAKRWVIDVQRVDESLLLVDPVLNGRLLGRRTFELGELDYTAGYPLVT